MTKSDSIVQALADENPEAYLADGFEKAIIGIARRCGQPSVAVYSLQKCIKILMNNSELTEEEAYEYFDFNVFNAWYGENTPFFLE
jgi:hypothetical protein